MKYDSVQLGEISEAIRGVTFSGDETSRVAFDNSLACLTTSGVQDVVNWDSHRFIPRNRLANSKQLLQEGDILISKANSKELVGKSCIVDRLPYEVTFGAFVTVLRPNKKVIPEYLAFWMRTKEYLDRCFLMSSNTTNISNLRTSELLEFQIPFPPLTEQKRIASLLARADRLRQLRQTAHDLGDALLQSVFLEMFGDPQFNDKKWDLVTLGDKITFMTRGSRGWAEHYSDKGDLFLRIQNVGANQLLLDDVAFVQAPDTAESKRTRVQPGDLLISATADLGRTAVIPENFPTAYINQHLFLLRLKDLNPVYVAGYFSTPTGKAQILRLVREGVKSGLNFDDARSLTVFNPPLSLQEEFAGVVARVESLRGRMGESTPQVEGLFESLLSESFGG
jgi:type I restriction enzyme S subunit